MGFDKQLTKPEVGIRALWLLYKRGQWGLLEDFGLDRKQAEPAMKLFEHRETVVGRLSKRQCRVLVQMVPGLKEAGKEIRLAYVLKEYSKEVPTSEVLSNGSHNEVVAGQ